MSSVRNLINFLLTLISSRLNKRNRKLKISYWNRDFLLERLGILKKDMHMKSKKNNYD